MSSVVLVSTNPLFVAVASALLFRERLRAATLIGIGAAIAGGAAVALLDICREEARRAGRHHGAPRRRFCIGVPDGRPQAEEQHVAFTLRRHQLTSPLRPRSSAWWLSRPPGSPGYPAGAYLWVLLLALGPQLLGHTSYNYALKYVSATFVTVTLLGEPIGASLLAIPLLSQVPSAARIAAGLCILAGIVIAARSEARQRGPRAARS